MTWQNLYGEVAREGYELPASCPLAKSNDMLLPLEAHKQSRASDRSRSSSSLTNPPSHTSSSFLFSSSLSRLGRHPPFPLTPSHHDGDDAEERKEEREREEEETEEEVEKGRDFGAARGTHR